MKVERKGGNEEERKNDIRKEVKMRKKGKKNEIWQDLRSH